MEEPSDKALIAGLQEFGDQSALQELLLVEPVPRTDPQPRQGQVIHALTR